jgi:L-threonylcarbamoyladenylate synthase
LFASRLVLQAYAGKQEDCAALIIGQGDIANTQTFCLPNNPDQAAERLYSTLHQIDALHKKELLVEVPPKAADWSAIRDRLERAAHKNT